MSWKNPTRSEAEEAYSQAKTKYQNAAESYLRNKKLLASCEQERDSLSGRGKNAQARKTGLLSRIEQIEVVISFLAPAGRIDELVYLANKAARSAEESLSGSLKCSDIQFPPVAEAFRCHRFTETYIHIMHSKFSEKRSPVLSRSWRSLSQGLILTQKRSIPLTQRSALLIPHRGSFTGS